MRKSTNDSGAFCFIAGLAVFLFLSAGPATHAQSAPRYQYDSTWPKELPNNWSMEEITGMFVDKNDHIWVLNRPRDIATDESFAMLNPPSAECCIAPPAVMEFDTSGNLLKSWGVPGSVPGWPSSEHTIFLDKAGDVYIGGAGAGDTLMKFTNDGKFLSDWGHRGPTVPPGQRQQQNNQETDLLLRGVAAATLDESAQELYIADGYLNRRVLVYDSETGAFKRGWGAYGIPLSQIDNDPAPPHDPAAPPAKQFRGPVHCVQISADGLVYVCDRGGDRVQVFTKQGKFLKEFIVANKTLDRGSVGSLSFSPDPQQKYIYISDIMNNVIWILNRNDGSVVGRIGHMGRNGGQFHWVHIAVTDSRGNVYAGEVESGRRAQKFMMLP